MEHFNASDLGEFINLGTGSELRIKELAVLISRLSMKIVQVELALLNGIRQNQMEHLENSSMFQSLHLLDGRLTLL